MISYKDGCRCVIGTIADDFRTFNLVCIHIES